MNFVIRCSFFFLFLSTFSCQSQLEPESPEQAKQLEGILKMLYVMYSPNYQPVPDGLAITTPLGQPSGTMVPWDFRDYSTQEMAAFLPAVQNTLTIKSEKIVFGTPAVTLTFTLPSAINLNRNTLQARLVDANFVDQNGQKVTLKETARITIGMFSSSSKLVDGKLVVVSNQSYDISYEVDSPKEVALPLKGSIEVALSYATSYEVLAFSAKESNVSKELQGTNITILSVDDNVVRYKFDKKNPMIKGPEASNEAGELVSTTIMKLREKDIMAPISMGMGVNEEIDAIFKTNPDISEADFMQEANNVVLESIQNQQQLSNEYKLHKFMFPLEKIVFYAPKKAKEHNLKASL